MTTERSIDDLLRKVQSAPNETLFAYSTCWEGLFPGDEPDVTWQQIHESEAATMRAAIRLEYLTATSKSWVPEYPEEYAPDGSDSFVTLSGLGTKRLLELDEQAAEAMASSMASEANPRTDGPLVGFVNRLKSHPVISTLIFICLAAWFLFAQVLSPSWICPQLPDFAQGMLAKCENLQLGASQ